MGKIAQADRLRGAFPVHKNRCDVVPFLFPFNFSRWRFEGKLIARGYEKILLTTHPAPAKAIIKDLPAAWNELERNLLEHVQSEKENPPETQKSE